MSKKNPRKTFLVVQWCSSLYNNESYEFGFPVQILLKLSFLGVEWLGGWYCQLERRMLRLTWLVFHDLSGGIRLSQRRSGMSLTRNGKHSFINV